MKVLFDCIVTAEPERCSTTIQFLTLAKRLLAHDGVYIYWPVPDRFTDEELEVYPESDRIRYFKVPQAKDRLKEYNRIVPELEDLLAFNGETWDWDVLVTVRSTQVPLMRILCNSPRQPHRTGLKRIVLIEDMMILSKKSTVGQSDPEVQDRMTLEAYMAADAVLMPAYHQKGWALEVARKHFSPARVRDIRHKVSEVCQLDMPDYNLKSAESYPSGRLGVAFVGRLEKHDARLKDLSRALLNQFILRGAEVDMFVCTIPQRIMPDMFHPSVEILRPNREAFWELCRNRMGVALSLHIDVELNLSMLEPVTLGVPIIVKRAAWSEAMFGKDYPFFVNGDKQMYGLITAFSKDYAKCYTKFSKWFKDWFVPTYDTRVSTQGLYNKLEHLCTEPMYNDVPLEGMCKDLLVKSIIAAKTDDFVLFDWLREHRKEYPLLASKAVPRDRDRRGLVWATPWNSVRAALIKYYGYVDGSVKPGHLIRRG